MNTPTPIAHEWFNWDISACLAVASCVSAHGFVALAVQGLELCCSAVEFVPSEVLAVAEVGRSDWSRGHDAFKAVRGLILAAENIEPRPLADPNYVLLFVAENAARMIYNASGTKGGFDEDSGAWLIRVFGDFARSLPPHQRERVTTGLRTLLQESLNSIVVPYEVNTAANSIQ